MTLLLDTHTVVWMTEDLPSLGKVARRSCDAALAVGDLAIPSIVLFELGWTLKRKRIAGPVNLRDWRNRVVSLGAREIGLSAEIAMGAVELEEMHGDPIDRIIVATALAHDAVLLTADGPILEWSGRLRRQDARR
jgi:PIN domain nuclease of toxin-antitoxin system